MTFEPFPDKITIGDKYGPAMKIEDQAEADVYFERCVEHAMRVCPRERTEAEATERSNLGYYAGYWDTDTRIRVEKLFLCSHPAFGKAKDGVPTPEEAFEIGKAMAANKGDG